MRNRLVRRRWAMDRSRFLRSAVIWLVFIVGFAPVLAQNAAAKPGSNFDQVVYPTGAFPTDTDNVQSAVDLGGSILLKATNQNGLPTAFNFGPPDDTNNDGGVFLTKDVEISGEQEAGHWTTIDGGVVPFRGWVPNDVNSPLAKVKTTISGIDFEAPLLSAIIIDWSSGSQIIGNRIANVQGAEGCYDPKCAYPFTEGRAIKFLGNGDPDHAITGKVIVSDNQIVDSHADLSAAIVFDEVAADATIEGNQIGSSLEGGIFLINSSGHVTIAHNTIAPGPGDLNSLFSIGNGIYLLDFDGRGAAYVVTDNKLDIENPYADGIILDGSGSISGAVVNGNEIDMHGTYYGAVSMFQNVSNSLIANNRIRGSASFGLDILQYEDGADAGSNTFVGNNLATFSASVADLFLDGSTHDTVFVGRGGTVIDLGANNHVTGLTPMGGATIGQQVSQAEALKRTRSMRASSHTIGR